MINQIIKTLIEARSPSCELDIAIHEVLTGELCQGNKLHRRSLRELHHAYGEILREHGGELKWTRVPQYTWNIEVIANYFHNRNIGFKIVSNPPKLLKQLRDEKLEHVEKIDIWTMSAWIFETNQESIGYAWHSHPGLCAALLALKVANRPKGALTCSQCLSPFVPDERTQEYVKGLDAFTLANSIKLCEECVNILKMQSMEIEGHG